MSDPRTALDSATVIWGGRRFELRAVEAYYDANDYAGQRLEIEGFVATVEDPDDFPDLSVTGNRGEER